MSCLSLRACLVAGLVVLVPGCGADTGADRAVLITDSAGIQIVTNGARDFNAADWQISPEPVLDIGVVEGDPPYQFMRVSGAVRLSDGRIAVANAGSGEVRFFDPEGRFLHAFGGPGAGPEEFRGLWGLWRLRGDSLLAWDPRLRRITVLTPAGHFARTATLQNAGANPGLAGVFADGAVLNVDERFETSAPGVVLQYADYRLHGADGALLDSLGRYPTMQTALIRWPDGSPGVGAVIFGPRTATVVGPDHFIVGTADREEMRVFAATGELRRFIRWPAEDRAVTDREIALYKERRLAAAGTAEERRRERIRLDQYTFAAEFPAYSEIRLDALGFAWVWRSVRPEEDDGVPRWLVFDPDGVLLGEVATPSGLRILDIGAEYLLGVSRDELDVEHVQMYALMSSGQRRPE